MNDSTNYLGDFKVTMQTHVPETESGSWELPELHWLMLMQVTTRGTQRGASQSRMSPRSCLMCGALHSAHLPPSPDSTPNPCKPNPSCS